MKKRIVCLVFAFLLCSFPPLRAAAADELVQYGSTGERVVRIQMRLRELGYFNYKPTGNYQSLTVECARRFQQSQTDESGAPVIADGTVGAQSMRLLFSKSAVRCPIDASIPFGPQLTGNASVMGTTTSWESIKARLVQNQQYTFIDFNTGESFNMSLVSAAGSHAEMECASAADTEVFLRCFGGAYNYSKRPMVMVLDGERIAASMQGEPHGKDTVENNNMEGQVCVYFTGSSSHVGSLPDVEHMNQIRKAAGQ